MKQFRTLISITLAMVLCFTGLIFSGVSGNIDVAAAAVVCTASLPFEVSVITAKDVYTVNACYATLAAAQTALNTLSASTPNVVVRHPASQSPSKIIAMDRGIATTYHYRTDSSLTINLYSTYNATTLTLGGINTYTQNYRDMQYLGTMGYNSIDGTGVIKIKVSGYVGYLNLKNADLIPMIYLDNSWSFTLGGTTTSAPFTTVPKMNKYTVETIIYNNVNKTTKTTRDLIHRYYLFDNSNSGSSFTYGPAPSWLPNGTYYSWDGINYYTDRDCKHPVYNGVAIGHYYQYFQYLPLRSDTNYSGAEIDNYLEIALGYTIAPTVDPTTGGTICPLHCSMLYHQGANFITSQNTYGMNALLIYSLAYHESGGGTSHLAEQHYNLFGWGAADSNPSGAHVFTSIKQSVDEMMGINLRAYLSPERSVFDGSVFGSKNTGINVHYASDLQWGEKIAGRAYTMDRWLGSKDYGVVDYAVFNDAQVINVEKTEGTDTTNLYTLPNTLKDESLILQSNNRVGGKLWARTPTTMPVSATGAALFYTDTRYAMLPYDRTLSKGFLITTNYNYMVPRLVDGKTTNLVQTLAWNANKLSIAGYGFVNGYNVPGITNAAHTLTLTSDAGVTSVVLTDGASNERLTVDFGQNRVSYDGAAYNSLAIDVTTLVPGTYTFGLTLAESSYGITTKLPFNYAGVLPADTIINGKFYKFQRLSDGTIKLNITYAIILTSYVTTPTNKNITVNASIVTGWTLNAASHTFTQNGTFTFTATDGKGGSVDRIVTIDNIDKTLPIITVNTYLTTPTNQNIIINVLTNEGSLNAISHTFTANGSFDFIATDAAGNVTTKTITITNIDKAAPIITGLTASNYLNTTPSITFNEGTAILDGIAFANGTSVNTAGFHTLIVTDLVGNSTTKTFTVFYSLAVPTNLLVTSSTYSSINLSWSAVPNASAYEIYRSATSSGVYSLIYTVNATAFSNSGLAFNTSYYYKIRAKPTIGSTTYTFSGYTSVISGKTSLNTPVITPVSSGYDRISVSWPAVSGVNGYEVYRSTSSTGVYTLMTTTTAVSYLNTALVTNTTYYYKVRAYRLVGTVKVYSAYSNILSAKPSPSIPSGIVASSVSYNSVKVAWTAVSGATGYEVSWSKASDGTYIILPTQTATSFTLFNQTTNESVYFKVRAYRLVGTTKVFGSTSSIVNAKPIPSTPALTVVSDSYNRLKISWAAITGANGYELYHLNTTSGLYELLNNGNILTYLHTGLVSGVNHSYKVKAYTLVNSVKVYSNDSAVVTNKAIPSIPATPKAAFANYNSIAVSYAVVTGATGYEIYRSTTAAGVYVLVTSPTTTSYTNTGLAFNTIYYYKVRAYTLVGTTKVYGGYTAVVSAKTALNTPVATAVSASYNSIRISWAAIAGVNGYELYRFSSYTGTYILQTALTATSYTHPSLITNATYYYKVRAYRLVGTVKVYSAYSSVVIARPVPSAPVVTSTNLGYNSVKANWAAVIGTNGYEVSKAFGTSTTFAIHTTTTSLTTTLTGLTTNLKVRLRVRSYRMVGTLKVFGPYSTVSTVTPYPVTPILNAAVTPSSIYLTWAAVPGITKYILYHDGSGQGTYEVLGESTTTSYLHEGLILGSLHSYKIVGSMTVGTTELLTPASAAISRIVAAPAVTGLLASSPGYNRISLKWNASLGAFKYEISMATTSTGVYTVLTETDQLTYLKTGLASNATYYFKVRPYSLDGTTKVYGLPATVVSAKTIV